MQGRCQKCGIRLPDKSMTICPKCMRKGLVFMRFLGLTKEYRPLATLGMVLVVISIYILLVPPALTKILIDNVLSNDNKPMVGWFKQLTEIFNMRTHQQWLFLLVATLAVATVLQSIVGWLRERLAAWINHRLGYDLRRDVFAKMEGRLAWRWRCTR